LRFYLKRHLANRPNEIENQSFRFSTFALPGSLKELVRCRHKNRSRFTTSWAENPFNTNRIETLSKVTFGKQSDLDCKIIFLQF